MAWTSKNPTNIYSMNVTVCELDDAKEKAQREWGIPIYHL